MLTTCLQQCKNYKKKSISIFQSYDQKCTATFLRLTVYNVRCLTVSIYVLIRVKYFAKRLDPVPTGDADV